MTTATNSWHRSAPPLAILALLVATAAAAAGEQAPWWQADAFERARTTVALTNGVTLGYVDVGPRGGRPVVLIHGFTDNAASWLPMAPYLDPRLRLILVDLRGHGRSGKPDCCYTRFDFAYDVRLLLDKLGIPAADVVGHSLGSIVAQSVAELWPDRTRRVVLISSTGSSAAGCAAPAGEPAFDWAAFRRTVAGLKQPLDPDSPFMTDWFASPGTVDAGFLRREKREAAAVPVAVWLAVVDQSMTGTDLQASLPLLRAPVLLIWGDKDGIYGTLARCALRRALPAATVEIFPDLGHNPFWEEPRAVAATVNRFLLGTP